MEPAAQQEGRKLELFFNGGSVDKIHLAKKANLSLEKSTNAGAVKANVTIAKTAGGSSLKMAVPGNVEANGKTKLTIASSGVGVDLEKGAEGSDVSVTQDTVGNIEVANRTEKGVEIRLVDSKGEPVSDGGQELKFSLPANKETAMQVDAGEITHTEQPAKVKIKELALGSVSPKVGDTLAATVDGSESVSAASEITYVWTASKEGEETRVVQIAANGQQGRYLRCCQPIKAGRSP